jgi:hypothetical protein
LHQAASTACWGGDELTRCSCGRPSSHVRLGASDTEDGAAAVRLTAVAHCGHDFPDQQGPAADSGSMEVRADLWPAAAMTGTPTRWADLPTAAFLISLTTTWLPLPLLVVDLASQAVFANRSWSSLSGLTASESMGAGWQDALDDGSRAVIRRGVRSPACRPCEINVTRPTSPHLRSVWLFMATVTGFDGRALGKVLWGPVPDVSPAAVPSQPEVVGFEVLDQTADDFVVRLRLALDEHRYASTTIAALVVEIHSVPTRSAAAPTPDERADERLGRALLAEVELVIEPGQTVSLLGPQVVGVLCPQVGSYREVVDLAERLVALAEPCSAYVRRGRRPQVTVGVAFPHLPDADAEALLHHALEASGVARRQGRSGFEVVIGTGPGSSDVTPPPADPVQEHLSAPSADLQAGATT